MPAAYLRAPAAPALAAPAATTTEDKDLATLAARAALRGRRLLALADGRVILCTLDGHAGLPMRRAEAESVIARLEGRAPSRQHRETRR
jgi:hypothetical protein